MTPVIQKLAECLLAVPLLGSEDFAIRQDAQERIADAGAIGYPAALLARCSPDPEIARRGDRLWGRAELDYRERVIDPVFLALLHAPLSHDTVRQAVRMLDDDWIDALHESARRKHLLSYADVTTWESERIRDDWMIYLRWNR